MMAASCKRPETDTMPPPCHASPLSLSTGRCDQPETDTMPPPCHASPLSLSTGRCGSPSSLSQATTITALQHMQNQLIRATHTISTMQGEIDSLNKKLVYYTNHNADTQQKIYDTEVRIKNTFRIANQDITTQLQDHETKLQDQLQALQSFKVSQNSFNTDIKKQLHSFKTLKATQHTKNQSDSATTQSDSATTPPSVSPDATIAVPTANRYAALSDIADLPAPAQSTSPRPSRAALHSNKAATPQHANRATQQDSRSAPPQHANRAVTPQRDSLSAPPQCSKGAATPPQVNQMASPQRSNGAATLQSCEAAGTGVSPRLMMLQQSVPLDYNSLLLGDSIMRRVDETKMSTSGLQVRNLAVPGLTVGDLIDWLTSLSPSPHVQNVTFHVGINSCREGPSQCRHLETSHLGAQAGLPSSSSAGLLHSPSLWPAPTEGGCITLHCKPEAGLPAGADHPYRPHPFIPLPGRCTK